MIMQPITWWWLIVLIGLALIALPAWMLINWRTNHQPVKVWLRRLILVVLLILMAFNPSLPGAKTDAGMTNLDVIFAVDTTVSMGAEDYNGNHMRLEGVRNDINALTKQMAGARFAVIRFDSTANVIVPMTSDATAIQTTMATLARENANASHGSAIDKPIAAILKQIRDDMQQNPQRATILFYLGDGEQTANSKIQSFAPITPFIKGGAVLGYGTAAGARMPVHFSIGPDDGSCDPTLAITGCWIKDVSVYDPNGTPDAISKINEKNLRTIASQLKLPYINRNNGGAIQNLVDQSQVKHVADTTRQVEYYYNLYWIVAIPILILLAMELLAAIKIARVLPPRSHNE